MAKIVVVTGIATLCLGITLGWFALPYVASLGSTFLGFAAIPSAAMLIGSISSYVVNPRETFVCAMQHLAAGIVLAALGSEFLPRLKLAVVTWQGGAAVFLGFIGGMALLMALKAVSGEEDEEEGYKVVPEEAEAAQPPSPVPEDAPADLSSNVTMEPEGVASRPPGGLSRRYTSMDEQDMRRRALMGLEGESATGSPWVRPAQAHPHHPHYRPLGFVRQAFGMHYTLSHGDDLGEVARPHGYAAYSVSTPGSMLDIEGYGAQQNGREPEPPFPLPLKVNHSAAPSLTATPTYHVAVPAPPSEASLVQRPFPSSMAAAVYIDSGIDGLFIGVAWVTAPSAAFIMAVSLGVEMAFLGLTFSITVQRSSGVGVLKKLCALLWGPCLLYIFAVVGAMASSAVMHYPLVFSGVSAFGTSALLYMVAEELLLSAHENPEIGHIWWIDVCFFIGFLIPIYLDA